MDRYTVETIFKSKNIKDKEGAVLKETIYNYLNSQTL